MAKKIGISESRFSDWKTGRIKPSPFEIFQMAELARLEPEHKSSKESRSHFLQILDSGY